MATEDRFASAQADARANMTSKGSAIRNALVWYMRVTKVGPSLLTLLGVVVLIMVLFNTGFATLATSSLSELASSFLPEFTIPPPPEPLSYPLIIALGNASFLGAMGLTMPIGLESDLSFGLTRKQHALALLLCGLILAGGLAITSVLVALPLSQFDLVQSSRFLLLFFYDCFFFLIGWLVIIARQYRHFPIASIFTVGGIALYLLEPLWSKWTLGTVNLGLLVINDTNAGILSLVGIVVLTGILVPTIITLTCRTPIKV
ncbi:MAG: hypothetical protein LBP28_00840 [Coriobacteriales bacterium]|jgi:hypothetical protein|nr:hypothetical protein [Coriobacteriales bacterium]